MPERPTDRTTPISGTPTVLELVREAGRALVDKKGEDLVILDVRESSSLTDYYVLISALSAPHLKALRDGVHEALKPRGLLAHRRAGAPESGWLVVDYVDFVIHIFSTQARAYYAIEQLWTEAPRVS